jgi:hypothetical protein
LAEEERGKRRKIADAIEVLRKHAGFGDSNAARLTALQPTAEIAESNCV